MTGRKACRVRRAVIGTNHAGGLLLRPDGKLTRRWDDLPALVDPWRELAMAAG